MNRTRRTEAEKAHLSLCAKARNTNPAWLFKCGFLLPHERRRIVLAAKAGIEYTELGPAWGVTASRANQIALRAGVRRIARARREVFCTADA